MLAHALRLIPPLLLLLLGALPAAAQEVQIPFDSSGRVQVITRELEEKLDLFPDVREFEEARLYRVSDTAYSLEIIELRDGARSRTQRRLTAAEADDLRRRVTQLVEERSPTSILDQEGRTLLLTGTTSLGLGYYGWSVPIALGIDPDDNMFPAAYLFTAAGSFFIPFFLTSNAQVTKAQASLALYGLLGGMGHGMLIYGIFGGEGDIEDFSAAATTVGLVEGVWGYFLARDMTQAQTTMISTGGIAGAGFGALAALLAGSEDAQVYCAAALLGSYGGSFAGNLMTRMAPYSIGDPSVVSTTMWLGAGAPPALLLLAGYEEDDGKLYSAVTMAGMIGGAILGHNLITEREFSEAQGNYISLGTIAAAAAGYAIGWTVSNRQDVEVTAKSVVAGSLIGGVGGFALMYALFEDDARVGRAVGGLHLDVSAIGLAVTASGLRPDVGDGTLPLATVSYAF